MPISTEIDPTQISGQCRFYEKEYPDLEECGEYDVIPSLLLYTPLSLTNQTLHFVHSFLVFSDC